MDEADKYEAQIMGGQGVDKYMPMGEVTETMNNLEKKYSD